jgi:hypothetical protein
LVLSAVVSRADQKIVGEAGNLTEIENYDFLRLLGLSSFDGRNPIIVSNLEGLPRLAVAWRLFG